MPRRVVISPYTGKFKRIITPPRVRRAVRRRVAFAASRSPYAAMAIGAGALGYAAYRGARMMRKKRMNRRRRVHGASSKMITHESFERGSPTTYQALERKTLAVTEINMNLPPNTNDTLGAAPGMNFSLSGFKICGFVYNYGIHCVEYHWAIIQAKDPDEDVASIRQHFFSDHGATTRTSRSFIEFATDPGYDVRNLCQGLYSQNVNIITHQKMRLAPSGGSTSGINDNFSNLKKIEKFIKVDKRLAYLSTTGTTLEKPFYLCTWYEVMDGPIATSYNAVQHNWHTIGFTRPK